MKLSDAGLAFIAHEEGFVAGVYKDFAGVPTIGYGHALQKGEAFPAKLTKAQAFELLRRDVERAETFVNDLVQVDLTQSQFDALVSFTFNCGGGALTKSTLLKRLNEGYYVDAAEEFLKWCKAQINGKLQTSAVLLGRRKRERAMFLANDDSTPDVA